MNEEPKSNVFDYERYGVFLRSARQRAHFNRAEDFCDEVTTFTGVKINKEALYRIEKGVQPPTVEQLIAFGLILSRGRGINDVLNKTELHHCVTPYAEYLAERSGSIERCASYQGDYYVRDEIGRWMWDGMVDDLDPAFPYIDEYYTGPSWREREAAKKEAEKKAAAEASEAEAASTEAKDETE